MFEITITEIRTVKKIVSNEWGIVGTKEVARDETYYRDDPTGKEPKTRIEEVRGYLPPQEREAEKAVEILKQTVETLDVAKVIKVINNV